MGSPGAGTLARAVAARANVARVRTGWRAMTSQAVGRAGRRAGAMGRATVFDLARSGAPRPAARRRPRGRPGRVARRYGGTRAPRWSEPMPATPPPSPRTLTEAGRRVLVNCAPYVFNLAVMEAALAGPLPLPRPGRPLPHDADAAPPRRATFAEPRPAGRAGHGQRSRNRQRPGPRRRGAALRKVRAIRVYNGGADFTRYPAPVAFGFAPATVLDEFTLPPMVFTRGRFRAEKPLDRRRGRALRRGAAARALSACTRRWRPCP